MMHLQTGLEGFDVFVRSLSIGAETMSMWFDPEKPMYDRYQVRHDFLTPELGDEIVSISRLVNAFFRWEFNSCETIVKDGVAYPIDYANASPDVALTSLHYYFPWAIKALVRWSAFCAVTRREMHVNQNSRDYFRHGDRPDLTYEQKLAKYRELADDYFQIDAYDEFCDTHLGHLDELAYAWFTSAEFDDVLVRTVKTTFPAHEHEQFVAHYRGLHVGVGCRQRLTATASDVVETSRGTCGLRRSTLSGDQEEGPSMTSTALATGKLGKLPVRTDVRTLRLRKYVDEPALPTPPASIDLTAHVGDWPMYANDTRGDCTTAAAGHMIEAWTAASSGQAVEVSVDAVLTAFEAVRLMDPADRRGRRDRARRAPLLAEDRSRRPPHRRVRRRRRTRPRADAHGRVALRRPLHRARAAAHGAAPGGLGLERAR